MAKEKKSSNNSTAKKKSTAQQAAPTASEHTAQPETDEIRRRAYEFYCERGGQHGLHEADWYRAESELLSK
jgi:DNA relaxase NicK